MFRLLVVLVVAAVAVAFRASGRSGLTSVRSSLQMSVKGGKGGKSVLLNMPRKLKRAIRSADTADKLKAILTPANDDVLKALTFEGVRESVLETLRSRANYLKVQVPATFGVNPAVKLDSIAETATKAGKFNTLLAAVNAANLASAFTGEGKITLFAPTDEAFAALPEGTVDELLKDIPKLTSILQYHVLGSPYKSKKVLNVKDPLETLNPEKKLTIKVDKTSKEITIGDGAKILTADIRCAGGGIVHVIDKVLLPQ